MILISKSYEVVTPESAEHGLPSDYGMESENVSYSFRELVDLIRRDGFNQESSYPPSGDITEWLSTYPSENYRTGESTTYSIHYSRDNKPRSAKYWRLAFIAAGIIKERN